MLKPSSQELGHTPDEKNSVDDAKINGETDCPSSPPLPMLSQNPVRLACGRDARIVSQRFLLVSKPVQIHKQLSPAPLGCSLNSTKLPFPERVLCVEPGQDQRHLKRNQHPENALGSSPLPSSSVDGRAGTQWPRQRWSWRSGTLPTGCENPALPMSRVPPDYCRYARCPSPHYSRTWDRWPGGWPRGPLGTGLTGGVGVRFLL